MLICDACGSVLGPPKADVNADWLLAQDGHLGPEFSVQLWGWMRGAVHLACHGGSSGTEVLK